MVRSKVKVSNSASAAKPFFESVSLLVCLEMSYEGRYRETVKGFGDSGGGGKGSGDGQSLGQVHPHSI